MASAVDPTAPSTALEHRGKSTKRLFTSLFVYLFLLTLAEGLTTLLNVQIGLVFHSLIFVVLLLHSSLVDSRPERAVLLALTPAPLIRLLSLSIPLVDFPTIYWYMLIGAPLLIATFVAARVAGFSLADIGIVRRPWLPQIVFSLLGLELGFVEYVILQPAPLATGFGQILLAAAILLIFTGFLEEVIFRGFMQRAVVDQLGHRGVVYISLLFAVLHMGYRSIPDLVFVFAVALLFSATVRRTGSIIGVSLAHGLTNISLYLIFPILLASSPTQPLAVATVESSSHTTSTAPVAEQATPTLAPQATAQVSPLPGEGVAPVEPQTPRTQSTVPPTNTPRKTYMRVCLPTNTPRR
jgi:uncharacterized protein